MRVTWPQSRAGFGACLTWRRFKHARSDVLRFTALWRAGVAALVATLGAIYGALPAFACVVCIELPEDTLTDRLWAADAVAFARPDASNSFVYAPTEVLRGQMDAPIPFLVDARTRRAMASDAELVALVLRMPDGQWELAGQGGAPYARFILSVLENEQIWSDQPEDPDRAQTFLEIHDHPIATLRRLALTEVAQLPYDALIGLEVRLPVPWITARLSDAAWSGWQPILVHMLGLHSDPDAHAIVRARALTVWPENRTPWLVALIEIDGTAAIPSILEAAEAEGTDLAALAAIQAMALQARVKPDMAGTLTAAMHSLATGDPARLAQAVPTLATFDDFSLAPDVLAVLNAGHDLDPADRFALRSYLSRARWGLEVPPSRMQSSAIASTQERPRE